MPILRTKNIKIIFEDELKEDNFETSLILFPLELSVIHFFT